MAIVFILLFFPLFCFVFLVNWLLAHLFLNIFLVFFFFSVLVFLFFNVGFLFSTFFILLTHEFGWLFNKHYLLYYLEILFLSSSTITNVNFLCVQWHILLNLEGQNNHTSIAYWFALFWFLLLFGKNNRKLIEINQTKGWIKNTQIIGISFKMGFQNLSD